MSVDSFVYDERLDHYVCHQIGQGFDNFGVLLDRLPGLYPTALYDSLRRLESRRRIPRKLILGSNTAATTGAPNHYHRSLINEMPTPHPLDFDWRFTPETMQRLRQLCLELSDHGDLIAYLGCPTVFKLSTERRDQRQFVLFDKNPAYSHWSKSGQVHIQIDLMSGSVRHLQAQTTLADPPWYQPYELAFLRAASRITKLGGFILITSPSLWTKQDVQKDWDSLFNESKELGLDHLTTLSGIIRYDSPYFERNSLRAAGLDFAPTNWRRGDLVLFRKVAASRAAQVSTHFHYDEWLAGSHFGFRIRKPGFEANRRFVDPSLISLVSGDIIPSVSRADPTRSLADVWTEGNRIFACRGPRILHRILVALEEGVSARESVCSAIGKPLRPLQLKQVSRTIRQVVDLINVERTERNRFEES